MLWLWPVYAERVRSVYDNAQTEYIESILRVQNIHIRAKLITN